MADKFVTKVPLPTPYQREIAECLAEECAEVIQRVMKVKRFGIADVQSGHELSNIQRLSDEVGDLLEVLDWAEHAGIVDLHRAELQKPLKRAKLQQYLQMEPGTKDGTVAAYNLALDEAAVMVEQQPGGLPRADLATRIRAKKQ